MAELTRRQRMKLPPVAVPERPAEQRRLDFAEVELGYDRESAMAEAERCLYCARPTCRDGCPVGVDIVEFVHALATGSVDEAAERIAADNVLPAVCGRVCPQEIQCEGACVLAKKGKAIHIGGLERYVADAGRRPPVGPVGRSGRRVAVIGSGPAGLACAGDLVAKGHEVVVFEALHQPGGVLAYGIPEFRLPRSVVQAEIDRLREQGVRFDMNTVIGPGLALDDLLAPDPDGRQQGGDQSGPSPAPTRFDAVFIGVGAGLPRFLGVPGEQLVGVYAASEFLTRVNLMRAGSPGSETPLVEVADRRVMVVGGGNTAMDAARTAVRLGARSVELVYRRGRRHMPARAAEVEHAEAEGVVLRPLIAPIGFVGDDEGLLRQATLQHMELVEGAEGGRPRPVPIEGATDVVAVDVAIIAIGNDPNPLLMRSAPDLDRTERGTLVVDRATGATSRPGVYAGGDIVSGGATVILAMGDGRRAAASINDYLAPHAVEPVDPSHRSGNEQPCAKEHP